uniref:60S ribosomal protein L10P insertion domain-containing protein n=1 Tax=Parascaris equorum TaxID=6256 RepID=A0A914R9C4_PAREQ
MYPFKFCKRVGIHQVKLGFSPIFLRYFNEFKESDYARGGQEATETVELPEGPLPQFPFSMEPQLRKLGLPTKLDKGVITLTSSYVICTEGARLSAEQARLLKLLQYKTSVFKVNLLAHWTKTSELSAERC